MDVNTKELMKQYGYSPSLNTVVTNEMRLKPKMSKYTDQTQEKCELNHCD